MMEIKKISDKEYFAVKAASNSALSLMKQSAAHGKYAMDNPPEETASMVLGSMLHCLVLEPEEFENRYYLKSEEDPVKPRKKIVVEIIGAIEEEKLSEKFYIDEGDAPRKPTNELTLEIAEKMIDGDDTDKYIVDPQLPRRSKVDKEKFAEWEAEVKKNKQVPVKASALETAQNYAAYIIDVAGRTLIKQNDLIVAKNYVEFLRFVGDKTIINENQLEAAKGMAASVLNHPKAKKLLSKGVAEQAVFWEDPDTGYLCKAKVDFTSDFGYLVDLKSTRDASKEEFGRSIAKFGYHRQDAFYTDGYSIVTGKKPKAFIFISVEPKPPYAVGVYRLDDEGRDKGRDEYKDLLSLFVECQRNDEWPAYSENVELIELPRWYK